jgi:hypothetical protein
MNVLTKIWEYVQQGKNVINIIIGVINLILLVSIKTGIEFSYVELFFIGIASLILFTVIGKLFIKKINPVRAIVNPFTQDNINVSIQLYSSLIAHYEGKDDEAIEYLIRARENRLGWLDK